MIENRRICNLSCQEFIKLCAAAPTPDEQKMLDAIRSIDSLTNPQECLALYRLCSLLPEGSKILEIGSFNGASAVAMGYAIQGKNISIYCIDPWANYLKQEDLVLLERSRIADDNKIINSFMRNTSFLGNQIKMMRGLSSDFASMVAGQNFDLIFIDGAHDYDSVKNDILMCLAALKPEGLLAGHDYHSMGHGVRQAVNEMIGQVHSITIKGTIDETYIWFAGIDHPDYLLELNRISACYASGDVAAALILAKDALIRYKTEELVELTSLYKTTLFMENRLS